MRLHVKLEPELGIKLVKLYEDMKKHPRIEIITNQSDASMLMSYADVCISFPYTSTMTEALSARKNAIWHDPVGLYRNTPYAKQEGLVTHSYDELLETVKKFISGNNHKNPKKNTDSPFLDPFCDGQAIERFRTLLLEEDRRI